GAAAGDRPRGPRSCPRSFCGGHRRSGADAVAAGGRLSAEEQEIAPMTTTTARFLMCRPDHFAVDYAINPWMNPRSWASESNILVDASRRGSGALPRALAGLGVASVLVPPSRHLPKLGFPTHDPSVLVQQT